MHEKAVAESILDMLLEIIEQQEAVPVKARIKTGAFSCLNDQVFKFAFEAIAAGTPCSDVEFEIKREPLIAECLDCGKQFEFIIHDPRCSFCDSENYQLKADKPLILESVFFD